MLINRRKFLLHSSVALSSVFIPKKIFGFSIASLAKTGLEELGKNFGIYTEKGGTIAWFIDSDAFVVIDSQFPESAENFYKSVKAKSSRKIDFLFNTHHHGDHTAGNFYLKQFCNKIIAQKNCVELQKKFYGDGEYKKYQVYADTTFDKTYEVNFGKEKIKAYHFGPAHTGGDAVYHFQNTNLVHMGDVVFNKVYPYMDRPGGATFKGAANFLDKCISLFDDETKFIFGHASEDKLVVGSLDDLKIMKLYYESALMFVEGEIKSGKSLEEVLKNKNIPGFQNLKEKWNGAKDMNLKVAFEELTNAKN